MGGEVVESNVTGELPRWRTRLSVMGWRSGAASFSCRHLALVVVCSLPASEATQTEYHACNPAEQDQATV